MRFFSNKIRVKANSQLSKILDDLNNSPAHSAIDGPHINPFHDIEESHEKNFSAMAPHSVQRIWGSSGSQPHFHLDHMGNKMAVVKPSSGDAMKESLAYQLSKHYAPGLIPMTVVRNHANPYGGAPSLHSVQQYIKPDGTSLEMDDPDLHNDKDYHRIAIMDWLHGNVDRHSQNMLPGEDGRLHAIDNAMSFVGPYYQSYDKDGHVINGMMGGGAHYNLSNINKNAGYHAIPQDIRDAILKADPHKLGHLFDKVNEHGVHLDRGAKEAYLDRLDTLKHHFANAQMQTMSDLHNALYTSPHEVFEEPDWYSH